MAQHPFPVDPVYSGVSLAYRNNAYIADLVLPRVQVGKREFKYRIFDKNTYLTIPSTIVGRKGIPSQVELSYSEDTESVVDYGLDDIVPYSDVEDAPEGYDPQTKAVEYLTELILLAREVRVANLVFNAGSYSSDNRVNLSDNDRFNAEQSDPIGVIKGGLDSCFMRPNTIVMGREVFSVLSSHRAIVQAIYPNSNGNGLVTVQQLAQLFDVDNVLIGNAWVNSAKKGKTAISRAWGKHLAMLHINPMAGANDMPTFGLTAEYGTRISGVIPEPRAGLSGANVVRVGERVKELIVAPELGYFVENAIS